MRGSWDLRPNERKDLCLSQPLPTRKDTASQWDSRFQATSIIYIVLSFLPSLLPSFPLPCPLPLSIFSKSYYYTPITLPNLKSTK